MAIYKVILTNNDLSNLFKYGVTPVYAVSEDNRDIRETDRPIVMIALGEEKGEE